MKTQPSMWVDFYHGPDGIEVGIECDIPSFTFDGHFVCLFPQREDESDSTGAMARAEEAFDPQRAINRGRS